MNELFMGWIKYIKRQFIVRQKYRKLRKKEIKYNQQMIQLGKRFQDLGLEDESAYQFLEELKETDRFIDEIDKKISKLTKENNKEELKHQEEKKGPDAKIHVVTKKLKEFEGSLQSVQKKIKEKEQQIHAVEKSIKKLEYDKKYINKEIVAMETKSKDVLEDSSQAILPLEVEIEDIEKEVSVLKDQLSAKKEELNKTKKEMIPFNNDIDQVKKEMAALKQKWKKKQVLYEKKYSDKQSQINEEKNKKELLETKKIIPYQELGKIVIGGSVEDKDLKSLFQKLDKEKKDIDEIKKQIVQTEAILRSPQYEKTKIVLLIVLALILFIIIFLFIFLEKDQPILSTPVVPSIEKPVN